MVDSQRRVGGNDINESLANSEGTKKVSRSGAACKEGNLHSQVSGSLV